MKLIHCTRCHDVVKLDYKMLFCKCGRVYGRYTDNVHAEVCAEAVSVAIGNGSLNNAVAKMHGMMAHNASQEDREYWIMNNRVDYTWVRPNEGAGNPHTSVIKDEDRVRAIEFCRLDLLQISNHKLDEEVVAAIVKEGWNQDKGAAFPAYEDPELPVDKKFIITDGNHRLEALKRLGHEFAPIVRITKEEFDHVAYQKDKHIKMIVTMPESPLGWIERDRAGWVSMEGK